MRKRKLRQIADIQLRERLQNLRGPLRKPTYDENKRIRKRREHRAELRAQMREANRPFRDSQEKQAKLGGDSE